MAQLTVINRIVTPATEVIYTYIIIVPFITVSWVITVDHGFIDNKHHGWADLVWELFFCFFWLVHKRFVNIFMSLVGNAGENTKFGWHKFKLGKKLHMSIDEY